MATMSNTIRLFTENGINDIATLKCNINSDNIKCKLNGRAESHIIETAYSPALEKHFQTGDARKKLISLYPVIIFNTP